MYCNVTGFFPGFTCTWLLFVHVLLYMYFCIWLMFNCNMKAEILLGGIFSSKYLYVGSLLRQSHRDLKYILDEGVDVRTWLWFFELYLNFYYFNQTCIDGASGSYLLTYYRLMLNLNQLFQIFWRRLRVLAHLSWKLNWAFLNTFCLASIRLSVCKLLSFWTLL